MHRLESIAEFAVAEKAASPELNRGIVRLLNTIDRNNQNTEIQIISFIKNTLIGSMSEQPNFTNLSSLSPCKANKTSNTELTFKTDMVKEASAQSKSKEVSVYSGSSSINKSKSLQRTKFAAPAPKKSCNSFKNFGANNSKSLANKQLAKSNTTLKPSDYSESRDTEQGSFKQSLMINSKNSLFRINSSLPEDIFQIHKGNQNGNLNYGNFKSKIANKNQLAKVSQTLRSIDKTEMLKASKEFQLHKLNRPSESIDQLLDRSRCEATEVYKTSNQITHLLSNHSATHSPRDGYSTNIVSSRVKLFMENSPPEYERLDSSQFSLSQSPNLDSTTKKILKSKMQNLDKKGKKLTFFQDKPEDIKLEVANLKPSPPKRILQPLQIYSEEYEESDFKQRPDYWIKGQRVLRFTEMVYDSLSDQELENGELKDTDIREMSVHPESKFICWINFTIVFGLAITIMISPIYFSMDVNRFEVDYHSFASGVFDIILIVEMILRFFIGFYHEDDLIFNFRMIALNYTIFGEFLFDVLITLPFNFVFLLMTQGEHSKLEELIGGRSNTSIFLHTFQWARWLRILGIFKLWSKLDYLIYKVFRIDEHGPNYKLILFIKLCVSFMMGIHILNCVLIYISKLEMCYGYDNWIQKFNFDNESYFTLYFISFYFNMATILSIGYGDITPVSILERGYMCFYMIMSVHVYSFIISWISNKITQNTKKEEIFNEKKEVLDNIVAEFNVQEGLEKQLIKSLNFMKKNYVADKEDLLSCLPDQLKNTLCKKIYENRIGELEFFKATPEEFIMFCTPRLQLVSLKKKEVVISIGDIFTEMYMVNKGNLNFYLGANYLNFKMNSMGRGYHFGDVNMYLNERSEYTIKSSSIYTEIFTLKKGNYSELKTNFPEIIDLIIKKSIDNFTNLEAMRNEAIEHFRLNDSFLGFMTQLKVKEYNEFSKSLFEEDSENQPNYKMLFVNNSCPAGQNVEYLTKMIDENSTKRRAEVFEDSRLKLKQKEGMMTSFMGSVQTKNLKLLNKSANRTKINENSIVPEENASINASSSKNKRRINIIQDEFIRHKRVFLLSKSYYEDQRKGSFLKKRNMDSFEAYDNLNEVLQERLYLYKKFLEDSTPLLIYISKELINEYRTPSSELSNFKPTSLINMRKSQQATTNKSIKTVRTVKTVKPLSIIDDIKSVFNDDSLELFRFREKSGFEYSNQQLSFRICHGKVSHKSNVQVIKKQAKYKSCNNVLTHQDETIKQFNSFTRAIESEIRILKVNRSHSCKDCFLKSVVEEVHFVPTNRLKTFSSKPAFQNVQTDSNDESIDNSIDKKKNWSRELTGFKRYFNSKTIKKVLANCPKQEDSKSKTPFLQSRPNFLEMNKDQMMKDFGRRIENNAFYENNMNIFEGYLKSFITKQKEEVDDKYAPIAVLANHQSEHTQSYSAVPKKKSIKSVKTSSSHKRRSHLDMYL